MVEESVMVGIPKAEAWAEENRWMLLKACNYALLEEIAKREAKRHTFRCFEVSPEDEMLWFCATRRRD